MTITSQTELNRDLVEAAQDSIFTSLKHLEASLGLTPDMIHIQNEGGELVGVKISLQVRD